MKISENMMNEIRFHLVFLAGPAVLVPCLWLAYEFGLFYTLPVWFVIGFGIFMTVGLYIWFRQGLSPDKTTFKVRIW